MTITHCCSTSRRNAEAEDGTACLELVDHDPSIRKFDVIFLGKVISNISGPDTAKTLNYTKKHLY